MQEYARLLILLPGLMWFPAHAKGTLKCNSEELKQRNCLLKVDKAHYQFLKDNLSIDDGVWKGVVTVPLEMEGTEWESLRLIDTAGRRFYELKIWTPPEEGVKLQSLHWLIVELKGTESTQMLDEVIQKRRPVGEKDQGWLKDTLEKHGLKTVGKKVHWFAGHKKGEF